ncbi:hypothetical protein BKA67DRAFT_584816 [Truncatella angustata]|uniref:Uncharacterized protein n=1 Tax=Truncatella angustata TaxID=152316 RepID=A0A9P8RG14_9PEZI|nr:uncharacterized protein BKA67DRAFT_584816 [Truncatella angustata]KAH6645339.1 hypothetical protein BKA67DRAFT_584816 [Truncatella angustata]
MYLLKLRTTGTRRRNPLDDFDITYQIFAAIPDNSHRSLPELIGAVSRQELSLKALVDAIATLDLQSQDNLAIIRAFEGIAYQTRTSNVPLPRMLSSLAQFNISRALMSNAEIFGWTAQHLHDDALSPFVVAGPWPPSVHVHSTLLPSGLRPTTLQCTVEHHPWIDLLPLPQLRDNMLRRDVDSFDEGALCRAFTGRGHERGTGILVWGESWDESGWEVTQGFAQSWGWVIAGCWDLFRSTNTCRAQRGERPLFKLNC